MDENIISIETAKSLLQKFYSLWQADDNGVLKVVKGVDYKERSVFFNKLKELGIEESEPKKIEQRLTSIVERLEKSPQETQATTPDKNQLEELERQAQERREAVGQTKSSAKKAVEDLVAKKEEVQRIKDDIRRNINHSKDLEFQIAQEKPVFLKVETGKEDAALSIEENLQIDKLRKLALEDPQDSFSEVTRVLEERGVVDELIKQGVSPEDAVAAKEITALKIVEELAEQQRAITSPGDNQKQTYIQPTVRHAILEKIADTNTKIDIKNPAAKELVQQIGSSSVVRIMPEKIAQQITQTAFGEKFTSVIFGPQKVNVQILASQSGSTHQINLNTLNANYQADLNAQDSNLNGSITEYAKQPALNTAGSFLKPKIEARLAAINPSSRLGKITSSPEFGSILNTTFGIGKPVTFEATNWFGQMALKFTPESAPILSGLSKVTGINFGVIAQKGTAEAVKLAVGTEVVVAGGATTSGALTAGAVSATTKAGVWGTLTAAFGFLGPLAPVASTIATWLGTEVLAKLLKKIDWTKVKKALPIALGLLGLVAGGPFAAALLGLGTSVLINGFRLAPVVASFTLAWAGILLLLRNLVPTTLVKGFAIGFIVLGTTIAIIMFIINSGAYIVPPSDLSGRSENPYISVTKTVEPSGPFENTDLPLTVQYTITVKATRGNLSQIKFEHECNIIKEGSNEDCPAPTETPPLVISTSEPYVFKFTQRFGREATDAIVSNYFCAEGLNEEGNRQKGCDSVSFTVGNAPIKCFNVNEASFGTTGKAYITSAINNLISNYSSFSTKLCVAAERRGYTINISYGGDHVKLWGYYSQNNILIYKKGVESEGNANYILFHELAHVLAWLEPRYYDSYLTFPGIKNEAYPYCFYNYKSESGSWPESERFAEAVSFFANNPCGNFPQRNPVHYNYVRTNIFD